MTASGVPEEGETGPDPLLWPTWRREPGRYASLVRYVSPQALVGLGFDLDEAGSADGDATARGRILAERLYLQVRDKRIAKRLEPYVGGAVPQQIRDPSWAVAIDRAGNCLDLSLMYAAMCLEVRVAPLLALTPGHAFVIVTSERVDDGGTPRPYPLPGESTDDGVTYLAEPSPLLGAFDDDAMIPVDVFTATQHGAGFDEAVACARGHIEQGRGVHLVDVRWLYDPAAQQEIGRDLSPFAAPRRRPSISLHVPGGQGEFVRYAAHQDVVDDLQGRSGTVVLLGPAGQGKSTIARRIALDTEFGAGWFLNASEPQSLVNSLAAAELAERNKRGESIPDPDRKGYSSSALARLHESSERWVVVLDNADGDPARLAPTLPRPNDRQLLLITTTEQAWAEVPGATVVALPPIDEARVAQDLGGSDLVRLVAGRALLLHAFRRLIESTGLSSAEIAARTPDRAGQDEVAGAAALWAAARASDGFGDSALELCRQMAYLPPDHQPLGLLSTLDLGAPDIVRMLDERGLVTLEQDTEIVRVHRLVGSAIRADLEHESSDLCDEAVIGLATDAGVLELLDDHGDLKAVTRLEERLVAVDQRTEGVSEELGLALHGVAKLLELHGHIPRSGAVYERAERHLDDHPVQLSDCLMGRARTVNQRHFRDEALLRQALEWTRRAQELLERSGAAEEVGRCVAMRGLIMKRLAAFPQPGETPLELLLDALAVLEQADELRGRLGAGDEQLSPSRRTEIEIERARSRYNLAGIRIDLAKRDRRLAADHLDTAEEIYEEVKEARETIYERQIHPHIAACVRGLALVAYHRAILLPATPSQRSDWLREATAHTVEALHSHAAQEGSVDLGECRTDARLLTKIALARHAPPPHSRPKLEDVTGEALDELERTPVRPLPADGRGAEPAIEAWVRSPALERLVAEFGAEGDPPAPEELGPLLEWLDDFSVRWDYRAGKERNLATPEDHGPDTAELVLEAAHTLGLVGTDRPPVSSYDHVLILGGLARACMARPLYAARLIESGAIAAGDVTALGAYRPLGGDELEIVDRLDGGGIADELDAMDAGTRAAFGLGEPKVERGEHSDVEGASWRVREYATASGAPVRVVAAPSSQPGVRRADTADTYAWFATELVRLTPGQRLLLVTSDIYVRFQHAAALRTLALPHSVSVDAIGIQPGDVDLSLAQEFEPHQYLQEVRSTIRALRSLHLALAEGGQADRAQPEPSTSRPKCAPRSSKLL